MPIRLLNEEQILDQEFRVEVIKEIGGSENITRKSKAFKAYEIYKDMTDLYVTYLLQKQFKADTVEEMKYSIANISIARKIVDKLARVYSQGVIRTMDKKREMAKLEQLADLLKVDAKMKKTNRYLKLFKNCEVMVKPYPVKLGDDTVQSLRVIVLPPYLYDTIEDDNNREVKRVLITSNFNPAAVERASLEPAQEGRGVNTIGTPTVSSNNIDETIADSPLDKQQEFVWWSDKYHFTTNQHGEIIDAGDNRKNPIGIIPSITWAEDQDNAYWAIGGSDLVNGSILINTLLTNMAHIAVTQGYGQAYMIGSNLPKTLQVGPNTVIQMETKEGEPTPTFGFANSNPPLSELREHIQAYTALLLSTNNLSTSGVKIQLNSGTAFPSGVAMMLDKAESIEDVQDQAQVFKDNEPEMWNIINKWAEELDSRGVLADELKKHKLISSDITIHFPEPMPMMTEKEKLEIIKMRKEMGLDSEIEMIMKDNPDMTAEQAEKKLLSLKEEKLANMDMFKIDAAPAAPGEDAEDNEDNEDNEKEKDGSQQD